MKPTHVRIADLKAHLSRHLRDVRRGRSITVFDRTTPVARIVPMGSDPDPLVILPPREGAGPVGRIKALPALDLGIDIVDLLLEDRRRR